MKKLLIPMLLLLFTLSFTACGELSKNEVEQLDPNSEFVEDSIFDDPVYDAEVEGATPEKKASDEKSFVGSWEAKSSRAEYLYGNICLTVKEDGTWQGNITDEDMTGTWTYSDNGITLSNDLINYNLFFDSNGTLIFQDQEDPEDYLVLTPAELN